MKLTTNSNRSSFFCFGVERRLLYWLNNNFFFYLHFMIHPNPVMDNWETALIPRIDLCLLATNETLDGWFILRSNWQSLQTHFPWYSLVPRSKLAAAVACYQNEPRIGQSKYFSKVFSGAHSHSDNLSVVEVFGHWFRLSHTFLHSCILTFKFLFILMVIEITPSPCLAQVLLSWQGSLCQVSLTASCPVCPESLAARPAKAALNILQCPEWWTCQSYLNFSDLLQDAGIVVFPTHLYST